MEHSEIPLRKLLFRIGLRICLIISAVLVLTLLAPPVLRLFLPFVLAFFAAALLAPLVRKVTKKGGRIWNFWSMLFVILLILAATGIIIGLCYYLFRQIADLIGSWDSILDNFSHMTLAVSEFVKKYIPIPFPELEALANESIDSLVTWVTEKMSTWVPNMVDGVGNLASGVANFAIALLFFVVGTYFITSDYPRLRQKLTGCIPQVIQPHVRHIREAMGSATFGYLKAQLILSGCVSLIIFLALTFWGQKYSLLIALVAGIIDLIPFFGSGVVLIPWAVIELILGQYSTCVFLLVLAFVLFLFRKLAEPKVVGNHTGLSPLLSLISIYVGMRLGGVLGMILAPILCMIVISLYRVGFFDPTVQDFKMLSEYLIEEASLRKVKITISPENKKKQED